MAAAVAVAVILSRTLETPRAYWLPMTTVLVLKPEFTVTFTRGLLRIAGTIAGLLLATAMFHFLPAGIGLEVVLIAAFVFLLAMDRAGQLRNLWHSRECPGGACSFRLPASRQKR